MDMASESVKGVPLELLRHSKRNFSSARVSSTKSASVIRWLVVCLVFAGVKLLTERPFGMLMIIKSFRQMIPL